MSGLIINPYAFTSGGSGGETGTGVVSFTTAGSNTTANFTLGWVFTPNADITLTGLRHYGADAAAADWRLRVHRNSDDTLMATVDITKVADEWVSGDVTNVTLESGVTYTASGRYISGSNRYYRDGTGMTYATQITVDNEGVYAGSVSDARPTVNVSRRHALTCDIIFEY